MPIEVTNVPHLLGVSIFVFGLGAGVFALLLNVFNNIATFERAKKVWSVYLPVVVLLSLLTEAGTFYPLPAILMMWLLVASGVMYALYQDWRRNEPEGQIPTDTSVAAFCRAVERFDLLFAIVPKSLTKHWLSYGDYLLDSSFRYAVLYWRVCLCWPFLCLGRTSRLVGRVHWSRRYRLQPRC